MNYTAMDSQANKYILKCLGYTILAFFIIWVLNTVGVFIVDKSVMTWAFILGAAVMLAPIVVCRIVGTEKNWIKYMILGSVELSLLVVGTTLTFHAVLLFALPLFYAAQYSNKKMVVIAYFATIASLAVSVIAGYRLGVCDLNMLLLSDNNAEYYTKLFAGIGGIIEINPNPWVTIPLYFILPRSLILLVFVPVVYKASENIAETAVRTERLIHISETDKSTQLYNKGKMDSMLSTYYPRLEKVGVIYWDINYLKEINDTFGHSCGDEVIAGISSCIFAHMSEERKCYRVGGDEFVMILENPKENEVNEVIEAFRRGLEIKNSVSKFPLSVSVGWAEGAGKDIEEVIVQADGMMYKEKQAVHKFKAEGIEE